MENKYKNEYIIKITNIEDNIQLNFIKNNLIANGTLIIYANKMFNEYVYKTNLTKEQIIRMCVGNIEVITLDI